MDPDEDDPCAQTLEALEEFIKTQRTLLARTHSDIGRLRVLKQDVVDDPDDFISNVDEKLDSPAFRLSEQVDCGLNFSQKIQWGAFIGHDLSPIQHLHTKLRETNTRRFHPSKTQTSDLSDMQRLVKNARKQIIDPVLVRFPPLPSPESSSDEEEDPEVLRRQREHEKIRELKKMKIRTCGLKLPGRGTQAAGVFIRHDVEDESMDVDISLPSVPPKEEEVREASPSYVLRSTEDGDYHPHTQHHSTPSASGDFITSEAPLVTPAASPSKLKNKAPSAGPRARRSTRTSLASSSVSDISRPLKRGKVEVDDKPLPPFPPLIAATSSSSSSSPPPPAKAKAKHTKSGKSAAATATAISSSKPKPETYKQAWSVSEQHLLEQLLEEIPEGEKFRWQKISRAMGGKRTPRQVASRVQKYFEKLKRFGVG